jgi:tRNA-dihydrouridine synthase B
MNGRLRPLLRCQGEAKVDVQGIFVYNSAMLKIGSLKLKSNVLLAPLAGISDSSFRLICREFGASFTFVEMINARAISHESKKTRKMLTRAPEDTPLGIQLLGAETPYLLKALDVIREYDFELLDFNAACPVRKVCRRGEGAALMKEPEKLKKILTAIVKAWPKPVTIKIRSGWDQRSKNAATVAQVAEEAGISAVFVHGRDKTQMYTGVVDYRVIAAVKKSVSVPVIASGDVWSALHAKKMFDETGCDGILVARGALGHPWIFGEIEEYFKTGRILEPPPLEEILSALTKHLELSVAEHGEKKSIPLMRKFVGWYLKGKRCVRTIRQQVNTVRTHEDFLALIDDIRLMAKQKEM